MIWKSGPVLFNILVNIFFIFTGRDRKFADFCKTTEEKYPNCYILMPIQSIGDLMICGSYMAALKKKLSGKIVLLVTKKNYDLIKGYPEIDFIEIIDQSLLRYMTFSYKIKCTNILKKGKVNVLNPDKLKRKSINTKEAYRFMLSLTADDEAGRTYPIFTTKNNLECNNKKNTILLSPFASSFNSHIISKKFWLNLASAFTDKGYHVVFNAPTNSFDNFECSFKPLTEIVEFAERCEAFIGFRSGFCDLIGLTDIKTKIIIYPNKIEHPKLKKIQTEVWKRTYYWNYNLSDTENIIKIMGCKLVVPRTNAEELIFNGNENELINYILARVENAEKIH